MITCFIQYEIDPTRKADFVTYARNWGQAIPGNATAAAKRMKPVDGKLVGGDQLRA